MKIRPVEAEMFHAGRQTGLKLVVAVCSFANAPNKARKLPELIGTTV